jgi:hypothetical protein
MKGIIDNKIECRGCLDQSPAMDYQNGPFAEHCLERGEKVSIYTGIYYSLLRYRGKLAAAGNLH